MLSSIIGRFQSECLSSLMLPFHTTYRKDLRLPQHLQRSMAAEAEAAREASAKVILPLSSMSCVYSSSIGCSYSSLTKLMY